jgi:hypothetical protein
MAQVVCIGPRQCRGLIHASRAIITDRGQKTWTLEKHPYLNTFINQLEPLFMHMSHQVFENRIFRICLQ